MTPAILIQRLILVGHRKDYVVNLNPGVNIIYGDADTGKSSILELISYLLGAKKLNTYEEIESSVKYAVLEIKLNNILYCIKRDIFTPSRAIEVYSSGYEEIDSLTPDKYHPTLKGSDESVPAFSDFLLESLRLPQLKTKQAPSKKDSAMVRFSFRDLFKYCYVDQDDLGSKKFLDGGNYPVEVKNAQTFKYIFNLLDEQISSVEEEISRLTSVKKQESHSLHTVSKFLTDCGFEKSKDIEEQIALATAEIGGIEEHLADVRSRLSADNEVYRALKDNYTELSRLVSEEESNVEAIYKHMQRYIRLKNDYRNDIEKFNAAKQSKEIIGKDSVPITRCPLCDSEMDTEELRSKFKINDSESINHELNSLRRRVRELDSFISEQRETMSALEDKLSALLKEKEDAKRYLDDNSKEFISPYITERDGFVSQLATLKQRTEELQSRKKLREQYNRIQQRIVELQNNINELSEQLDTLKENAPSESDVIYDLGSKLRSYMESIHIKNPVGIKIHEKKYMPIVRDTDYRELNSGGLRTITSIGYLCSIMSMAVNNDINIPPFLMIDTVGKYLGKTKESYLEDTDDTEDSSEAVADPSKYKNIYEYLIDLNEQLENSGKISQFILVDNDVPPEITKEYSAFVIAHFSTSGAGDLPIGLIDDVDLIPPAPAYD
jgi:hypothetical protein